MASPRERTTMSVGTDQSLHDLILPLADAINATDAKLTSDEYAFSSHVADQLFTKVMRDFREQEKQGQEFNPVVMVRAVADAMIRLDEAARIFAAARRFGG